MYGYHYSNRKGPNVKFFIKMYLFLLVFLHITKGMGGLGQPTLGNLQKILSLFLILLKLLRRANRFLISKR